MTQWLSKAQEADLIVCFVDDPYLDSGPCCREFLIARKLKRNVIVALDDTDTLAAHPAKGDNGQIVTHFIIGGQCLLAAPGQKYAAPAAIADAIVEKLAEVATGSAAGTGSRVRDTGEAEIVYTEVATVGAGSDSESEDAGGSAAGTRTAAAGVTANPTGVPRPKCPSPPVGSDTKPSVSRRLPGAGPSMRKPRPQGHRPTGKW